jgi:flagellar motor protein MotB
MTRPIDTNNTPEGRQNNRRVELHIETNGEAPPH